jgi:hypothetical protein
MFWLEGYRLAGSGKSKPAAGVAHLTSSALPCIFALQFADQQRALSAVKPFNSHF